MSDIQVLAIVDIPAAIFGSQLYEAKVPGPAGPGTWDVGALVFSARRGLPMSHGRIRLGVVVQQAGRVTCAIIFLPQD